MKKFLLYAVLASIITFPSFSQDIIYKEEGDEVKTRILEVGKKSILYKDFNDPDFTTRIMPLSAVKKIKFEDGTEKSFDHRLKKHFIAFSVVGSNPEGVFESSDAFDERSGHAIKGGGARLEYGIYLFKNLALNLSMGGVANELDTNSLKTPYHNIENFSINAPESGQAVNYSTKFFLFGPMYSFRIGKKLLWDFRLQTGFVNVRRSSFVIKGGTVGDNFYYSYEPAKGTAIGLNLGSAVRFNILKWLGIRFSADMLWSKPQLKGEVEGAVSNFGINNRSVYHDSFYQKVRIGSMGIGLVFMFGK